jgi:hypothetical protein
MGPVIESNANRILRKIGVPPTPEFSENYGIAKASLSQIARQSTGNAPSNHPLALFEVAHFCRALALKQ